VERRPSAQERSQHGAARQIYPECQTSQRIADRQIRARALRRPPIEFESQPQSPTQKVGEPKPASKRYADVGIGYPSRAAEHVDTYETEVDGLRIQVPGQPSRTGGDDELK
jgi:hypothetical protein